MATADYGGFLLGPLSRALPPAAIDWLVAEIDRQRAAADERRLAIALGLASRKIGRLDLALTADEAASAQRLRAGWRPELWAADEAARILILMASHGGDDPAFAARVDRLCAMAEVTEYIAYLKGFAIFPAPKLLYGRAREGVRSAITPVFAAIACHNPYPFDHFDEDAWNQMVVKCRVQRRADRNDRRIARAPQSGGRADAARSGVGTACRGSSAAGRRSRLRGEQLNASAATTCASQGQKSSLITHATREITWSGL